MFVLVFKSFHEMLFCEKIKLISISVMLLLHCAECNISIGYVLYFGLYFLSSDTRFLRCFCIRFYFVAGFTLQLLSAFTQ